MQSKVRKSSCLLVYTVAVVVTACVAEAQSRRDCSAPTPPGFGIATGRSLTPLLELLSAPFGAKAGSIFVRGGVHLAGRMDVPIAGPWRGRVEVSGANWPIEHQTYGLDLQLLSKEKVGDVRARQILAMAGRQGGRSPACGYVLAGGGFYSLDVHGTRLRRAGAALAGGIELPVTERGAVQFEGHVYMIPTGGRPPVAGTGALGASITLGWSHRF